MIENLNNYIIVFICMRIWFTLIIYILIQSYFDWESWIWLSWICKDFCIWFLYFRLFLYNTTHDDWKFKKKVVEWSESNNNIEQSKVLLIKLRINVKYCQSLKLLQRVKRRKLLHVILSNRITRTYFFSFCII